MKNKFYILLEENGKFLNDKADVIFNKYSIDVIEIDEHDGDLVGKKFYNVYEAYDFLEDIGALDNQN